MLSFSQMVSFPLFREVIVGQNRTVETRDSSDWCVGWLVCFVF